MADNFPAPPALPSESLFQFISRHVDMLKDRETDLGRYPGDGPAAAQASELVNSLRPFTEEADVTAAQTWQAFRNVVEIETAWLFPEKDPLGESLIFALHKAQELIGKWLVDSGTITHEDLDKYVNLHVVQMAAKRQIELRGNGINWGLVVARFLHWLGGGKRGH
jgi:hypothetical protein